MSRWLSAIKLVHNLQNRPDPSANALVVGVWEGIRRQHNADPDQAQSFLASPGHATIAADQVHQ